MNQRINGAVFVKLEEIELSDLLYLSTDSSLPTRKNQTLGDPLLRKKKTVNSPL